MSFGLALITEQSQPPSSAPTAAVAMVIVLVVIVAPHQHGVPESKIPVDNSGWAVVMMVVASSFSWATTRVLLMNDYGDDDVLGASDFEWDHQVMGRGMYHSHNFHNQFESSGYDKSAVCFQLIRGCDDFTRLWLLPLVGVAQMSSSMVMMNANVDPFSCFPHPLQWNGGVSSRTFVRPQ